MQCLILAGGLGTRLGAAVHQVPKPLVRLGDRPFLEYLILQLAAFDIRNVLLCTGYRGEQVRQYFGDGARLGVSICYSQEPAPLGTGGAIKYAQELIVSDPFLVMNGDSYIEAPLDDLLAAHVRRGALATLVLARVDEVSRFGSVRFNARSEVTAFVEKGGEGSGLVNAGLYAFSRGALSFLPEGSSSLEHDLLPRLVGSGLFAMPIDGYFVDIGTSTTLEELQRDPSPLVRALERQRTREVKWEW